MWHSLTVSPWDDFETVAIVAGIIALFALAAAVVSALIAVPLGLAVYAAKRWGPTLLRPWKWNTYSYGIIGFAVLAMLGQGLLNLLFAASCAGLAIFSEAGW